MPRKRKAKLDEGEERQNGVSTRKRAKTDPSGRKEEEPVLSLGKKKSPAKKSRQASPKVGNGRKRDSDVDEAKKATEGPKRPGQKRKSVEAKKILVIDDSEDSEFEDWRKSIVKAKTKKTPGKNPVGRGRKPKATSDDDDDDDDDESAPVKKRGKKAEAKKKEEPSPVVKARSPSPSSSSESEWEDVADHPDSVRDAAGTSEGAKAIQITVNAPKTKKELDIEGELRRALKRFRKELQENLHKAHLLTFIAYGRNLAAVCNDEINQAVALSMVPKGYTDMIKNPKMGKDLLKVFVKWFCSAFTLADEQAADTELVPCDLALGVRRNLQSRIAFSHKMLVLCFVTTIRALGFDARIVFNAHPITRKLESEASTPESLAKKSGTGSRKSVGDPSSKKEDPDKPSTSGTQNDSKNSTPKSTGKNKRKSDSNASDDEWTPEKEPRRSGNAKTPGKKDTRPSTAGGKRKSKAGDDTGSELTVKSETCEYWAEVFVETVEQWFCVNCIDATIDNVESIRKILTPPVLYCLAFDRDLALKDVTSRYASDFMSTQTRRLRAQNDWLTKTFALFRSTKRIRNRLEDMQLEANLSDQSLPMSISEYKNHPLYVLKRDLKKFEAIYPANTKPVGYIRTEPIYPRSAVHTLHSKDTWRKEALSVRENEKPYKIVKGRPKWDSATKQVIENREVEVYGRWQTEPYRAPAAKNGMVPRNEYGNVYLFKKSMLPPGTAHLQLPGLLSIAKKMDVDCAPAMVGWDFHGRASHPILDGWVVCEEYKDALVAAWEEEQAHAEERERERRTKKALHNWRRLVKALLVREKLRRKFKPHMGEPSTSYAHKNDEDKAGKEEAGKSGKKDDSEAAGDSSKAELEERIKASWPQRHHEFTGNQDEEL